MVIVLSRRAFNPWAVSALPCPATDSTLTLLPQLQHFLTAFHTSTFCPSNRRCGHRCSGDLLIYAIVEQSADSCLWTSISTRRRIRAFPGASGDPSPHTIDNPATPLRPPPTSPRWSRPVHIPSLRRNRTMSSTHARAVERSGEWKSGQGAVANVNVCYRFWKRAKHSNLVSERNLDIHATQC